MSAKKEKTGVVFCNCGGRNFSKQEIESLQTRLRFSSGENLFFLSEAACTKDGSESLQQALLKNDVAKLVFAGCTFRKSGEAKTDLAKICKVAPGNILEVPVSSASPKRVDDHPFGMQEDRIRLMVKDINKNIKVLELMEPFAIKNVPLSQNVLVIGGGSSGKAAVETLSAYGYSTVLIDSEKILPSAADKMPETVETYANTALTSLSGHIGGFTATIKTGDRLKQVECGAVILASGFSGEQDAWKTLSDRCSSPRLVPLLKLSSAAAALPRVPSVRSVAIILDLDIDEGKASTEIACRTALELQKRNNLQVFLFCRDIRVGSLYLEELYDKARDGGAVIVKYDKEIKIAVKDDAVLLSFTDAVLGSPMTMTCDMVGISLYGVATGGDLELAEITGVNLDSQGRLQDNNIQLFAAATNIPGIFVAGGCRGSLYQSDAILEGKAAAGAVHLLLSQKQLQVELSEATVDADKCALCLTCIRACPHNAMKINREENVAVSVAEVCQRCGICAGECPAKAITLPAYSDDILLTQLPQSMEWKPA